MRYLSRTVLGLGLLTAGLTLLAYGIAQAIEIGNCGTDDYGRPIGPPCPEGTGPMIVLMVLGVFAGIFGGGLYAARGTPAGERGPGIGMGIAVGQLRFWAAAIPVCGAAAVIGIVDLHEDEFRPGLEIVAAALAGVLLVQLLGMLTGGPARRARPSPRALRPDPGAVPAQPRPSEAGLAGLGTSTVADSGLGGTEASRR